MTGPPPIDVLLAYRSQILVAMFMGSIACVVIGFLVVRRRPRWDRILWALVASSVLPVLALTLGPSAYYGRDEVSCAVQFVPPTLERIELMANIALFFPLAFFATLATRRPLIALVACSGLSAALEAIQAVAPVIGRACDTNDWLMNSIGTFAGVVVGSVTIAVASRTTEEPTADGRSR